MGGDNLNAMVGAIANVVVNIMADDNISALFCDIANAVVV